MNIVFFQGELTAAEQTAVTSGFSEHSRLVRAPDYARVRYKWIAEGQQSDLLGALTADVLWDWLYIDELWVRPDIRGAGFGRKLMQEAEDFATGAQLQGVWLWTQSWQAEGFYRKLGYAEFTRFDNFPRGYYRVGFRKALASGWVG
jgi:GNAT superfamily N-acetyltransferase